MKSQIYLLLSLMILNSSAFARNNSTLGDTTKCHYPVRTFTTEPAIGLTAAQITGAVLSNVVQWNIKKRLSVVSYTAYVHNNAFLRDFNYIKTNYNYSLTQKFGIGTSFSANHFSHTFSFIAGVKYDTYKETLHNPEFEEIAVSLSTVRPDFGMLYNMKVGKKKYFFSFRTYIPLYPYPFKTTDKLATDGNLANWSLEFGVGIKLK